MSNMTRQQSFDNMFALMRQTLEQFGIIEPNHNIYVNSSVYDEFFKDWIRNDLYYSGYFKYKVIVDDDLGDCVKFIINNDSLKMDVVLDVISTSDF